MVNTIKTFASSISSQTQHAADGAGSGSDLQSGLGNIIQAAFFAVGIAAVIVIIIGGFNYASSQGDPSKITKAKNMILYGVIGLIVAVLAFAIVHFILNNV